MGELQEFRMSWAYDWHVHVRGGQMLRNVVGFTSNYFHRALIMPNTVPPILTATDALNYRREILELATQNQQFEPMMTIQITPETTPKMVEQAKNVGVIAGKLYPEGVTTNSGNGVRDFAALSPVFEAMEAVGMVLCVHGEMPDKFCLDREAAFLRVVSRIQQTCRQLRIVLEHITTTQSVDYVQNNDNMAATITLHHLMLTLDDVIGDRICPHYFCKPVAKRPEDRRALLLAATSDDRFFFGSDSAPHLRTDKECAHGCAGIFTAPVAIPTLVQIFSGLGNLENLRPFLCWNGAKFYGGELAREHSLTLVKQPWIVPDTIAGIVPFMAGQTMEWQVVQP
jgi:dihydroorotase